MGGWPGGRRDPTFTLASVTSWNVFPPPSYSSLKTLLRHHLLSDAFTDHPTLCPHTTPIPLAPSSGPGDTSQGITVFKSAVNPPGHGAHPGRASVSVGR